jgi:hypothetical protein
LFANEAGVDQSGAATLIHQYVVVGRHVLVRNYLVEGGLAAA